MRDLVLKYGQEIVEYTIKVDMLSDDEIADTDYLEDRILTHLETLKTLES
jgi:hypothetical protein